MSSQVHVSAEWMPSCPRVQRCWDCLSNGRSDAWEWKCFLFLLVSCQEPPKRIRCPPQISSIKALATSSLGCHLWSRDISLHTNTRYADKTPEWVWRKSHSFRPKHPLGGPCYWSLNLFDIGICTAYMTALTLP